MILNLSRKQNLLAHERSSSANWFWKRWLWMTWKKCYVQYFIKEARCDKKTKRLDSSLSNNFDPRIDNLLSMRDALFFIIASSFFYQILNITFFSNRLKSMSSKSVCQAQTLLCEMDFACSTDCWCEAFIYCRQKNKLDVIKKTKLLASTVACRYEDWITSIVACRYLKLCFYHIEFIYHNKWKPRINNRSSGIHFAQDWAIQLGKSVNKMDSASSTDCWCVAYFYSGKWLKKQGFSHW